MSLSLKLAVISATVLSTAVMFNLLSPFINDFQISNLPSLWNSLISWLKPPYLYVVINCIIITIVASSRLQSKIDGSDYSVSTIPVEPVLIPVEPVKVLLPFELPPVHVHEPVMITEPVGSEYVHVSEPDFGTIANEVYKEIAENRVDNKSVISVSTWTPMKVKQVDVTFPVEKPPASARFSHRKPTKATTEGGKTLGVTKQKKQDTLEATWKTITEGRSVPLTRHLRKSDTWETHGNSRQINNSDELSIDHHSDRMTKSDTFDVNRGGGSRKPPPPPPSKLSRSGGSGRLKKEPSLGQEELNRRVEAFIKKFNEDMRLQRQESLNQYMEMINRGTH